MATVEEKLIEFEFRLKHNEDSVDRIDKSVEDLSKRMNKTDIKITKIDSNVTVIKEIVEKLDKRDEERKIEAEKNINEFKKKCFYYVVTIGATIILAALGIKKLM